MSGELKHETKWYKEFGEVHVVQTWRIGGSSTTEWVKLTDREAEAFADWVRKEVS